MADIVAGTLGARKLGTDVFEVDAIVTEGTFEEGKTVRVTWNQKTGTEELARLLKEGLKEDSKPNDFENFDKHLGAKDLRSQIVKQEAEIELDKQGTVLEGATITCENLTIKCNSVTIQQEKEEVKDALDKHTE